jgi:REP element-mobilizing transposase RayT
VANTYTQIYLHVVFAVSGRICLIEPKRKEELQKYITGIVTARNQKLIAINCLLDHTHILLGLKPDEAPSALIAKIKTAQLITSTSRNGLAAVFHGRKDLARFLFRIRI